MESWLLLLYRGVCGCGGGARNDGTVTLMASQKQISSKSSGCQGLLLSTVSASLEESCSKTVRKYAGVGLWCMSLHSDMKVTWILIWLQTEVTKQKQTWIWFRTSCERNLSDLICAVYAAMKTSKQKMPESHISREKKSRFGTLLPAIWAKPKSKAQIQANVSG